jgi:hypothetical protein
MLQHVAPVRTDVSEEPTTSITRVTRIGELGRLAVTSKALGSSEMPVLTRATWRNIPEDGILHSHRRENLKIFKTRHLHNDSNIEILKQ